MSWALVIGFLIGYIGEQVIEAIDHARAVREWRRHFDSRITHTDAPARAEIDAGRDL